LLFAPLPVTLTPPSHAAFACGDQPPPQRLVIDFQPVGFQILRRQRRAEVPVAFVVARQHTLAQFRRFASQRGLGWPRSRCTSPASPSV
jgi:hypothetical protein